MDPYPVTDNPGPRARDIWRKDINHVIHPFSDLYANRKEGCNIISSGEGIFVKNAAGDKFIDGMAGLWAVNIGYGREEMVEAISEQIRRIPFFSTFGNLTNEPQSILAEKLSELAPGNLNHVFFGAGGSVANDTSIRLLHHYYNCLGKPGKKQIISRENAYHGSTYLAMSLTGTVYHTGFDTLQNLIHHLPAPYSYRHQGELSDSEYCDQCVQDLEDKILELGPDKVACFIAEPIMGAGGVIVPPAGYHKRTWEICKKYDVLYISDEVITAFGRLGHMFASRDMFEFQPDIINCAKGITSGYQQLSATIVSDDIYEVISAPGNAFYHGFTYSGHPVACAAALKNIEILEREKICEQVRKTGPYFHEKLMGLSELEIIGDIRGSHFMACLESVSNKETKELFSLDVNIGKRIAEQCQKLGLIVRPLAHLNVLSPPLIVTEADIDEIVRLLGKGIELTIDELVKESLWMPH